MKLEPRAVNAANQKLWAANPQLAGRQLTMEPKDAALRKEWMDAYRQAEADVPRPPPPAAVPEPVEPPPAEDVTKPVQDCPFAVANMSHTEKMLKAVELSYAKMPESIRKELPEPAVFAGMLAAVGAVSLVATVGTGGVAAVAAGLLTGVAVLGAFMTGMDIGRGLNSLMEFYDKTRCDKAQTMADLDEAAGHFADAAGQIGAGAITGALTFAAGKLAKVAKVKQLFNAKVAKIKKSGIVDAHADHIAKVAKKNDQIIIFQEVNPKAAKHIEGGAATKGMDIKAKSDPDGLIPMEQKNSLKGQKMEEGEPGWIAKTDQKTADLVKKPGEAKPGEYTTMKSSDAGGSGDYDVLAVVGKDGKPVPVTSDYDMLAVGSKKPAGAVQNTKELGYHTKEQAKTIDDINDAVDHPGGKVVHHGPENMYNGEGPKYPATAFEPDGTVKTIHNDAEMKTYFNEKNAEGYDLQAPDSWGWASGPGGYE